MSWKGRLTLEPLVSEVARLNDWLEAAFAQAGTSATIAADIKLCLNEVMANLISYAFAGTPKPQIDIAVDLLAHEAKAEVCDNGAYFDLRAWPDPPRPQDVKTAQIGGYGILLVRSRASSIEYGRVDGINRLRITCSGTGPETGPETAPQAQ